MINEIWGNDPTNNKSCYSYGKVDKLTSELSGIPVSYSGTDARDYCCREPRCSCQNGIPAGDANAPDGSQRCTSEVEKCVSCNEGYTLFGNECKLSECPIDLHQLPQNYSGTMGDAGDCVNYTCSSPDNCIQEARGQECHTNNAVLCSNDPGCNVGFHLNEDKTQCIQNECSLPTGCIVVASGVNCTVHQGEYCSSTGCDNGYHFNSQTKQCDRNICQLPSNCNTVAVDLACTEDGASICSETGCNPGHHFNSQTKGCDINACTCNNGAIASGVNCPVDGARKCSSCIANYVLINDNCVPLHTTRGGSCINSSQCSLAHSLACSGGQCKTTSGHPCNNDPDCVSGQCNWNGGIPFVGGGRWQCA